MEQDLWHTLLLTQVNGRIGSRLGRARSVPAASLDVALFQLAGIAKRRRLHGYELTHWHHHERKELTLDTIADLLTYMKRQADLRATLDAPGAVLVNEERELPAIDLQLDQYAQGRCAVV